MEKRFEINASSDVLPPLRKELRQILSEARWGKKIIEEILLAVDEALTNIIRHAYQGGAGQMTVSLKLNDDKIDIVLEDRGAKFDPTQLPPPELPRLKPGGLGIHFIRTVMDEIRYDRLDTGVNRLCLVKYKNHI